MASNVESLLAIARTAREAEDARIAAIETGGTVDGIGYTLAIQAYRAAVTSPDVVIALCERVQASEETVRTVLENNDRLTKAINGMPEWERAVREAVKVEEGRIAALEAGLREALDEAGYYEHDFDRIARLRKLVDKDKP